MSRNPLLLLGAGGHARACIDVIEQEGRFTIGGLVGLESKPGIHVLGYPVLGTDADVGSLIVSPRAHVSRHAENLTTKPGTGISPMRWDEVLGTKARRAYEPHDPIEPRQ